MNKLISIVKNLISHKNEEEWFEFKENWFESHALGEYISAMSNSAAMVGEEFAYFIWGIENKTHNIKGTSFDIHQDVKNEPLQHYLARMVKPDIGFEFHEIEINGKRIVILAIPAAKTVPTSFDHVRYLRIGSSKVNLLEYPEREAKLFDILKNGIPTIENTESEFQNLTFNKLFVYYETKGITLNKRTFKKNLGLLTKDGKYNLLAQLLSDNSHITVRFSLFSGKTKASTMYSVREFGNTCLLYSLDDVLRYGDVLNIPQADERNRVVERKEIPLFHAEAYREAVINAFVHNLWIDGNAPMFTGFQDRIEILSRGKLPPKQTVEGFFAGESVPVNQKLSDIFIQLHISERSGRGIPKITELYGEDCIEFRKNSIMVTIPFDRLKIKDNELDKEKNVPVKSKNVPVNVPDESENVPVKSKNAPVNVPDESENAPVKSKNVPVKIDKREIIIKYCQEPKSVIEIANFLGYKDKRSIRKYIDRLLVEGRIARTIPDKPNSRNQKYIAIK